MIGVPIYFSSEWSACPRRLPKCRHKNLRPWPLSFTPASKSTTTSERPDPRSARGGGGTAGSDEILVVVHHNPFKQCNTFCHIAQKGLFVYQYSPEHLKKLLPAICTLLGHSNSRLPTEGPSLLSRYYVILFETTIIVCRSLVFLKGLPELILDFFFFVSLCYFYNRQPSCVRSHHNGSRLLWLTTSSKSAARARLIQWGGGVKATCVVGIMF